MDRYGNLSNFSAPLILIHYDFMFEETGFWPFKFVHWITDDDHMKWLWQTTGLFSEWNVAVLCPTLLEKQIEELLKETSFRRCYTYDDIFDIRRIAAKREELKIAYYFDRNTERGSMFGSAWRVQDLDR